MFVLCEAENFGHADLSVRSSALSAKKVFRQKTELFRHFPAISEAESHFVGYFGAENFPQALISKNLQIFCKDFGEIYAPGRQGGGGWGYPSRGQ